LRQGFFPDGRSAGANGHGCGRFGFQTVGALLFLIDEKSARTHQILELPLSSAIGCHRRGLSLAQKSAINPASTRSFCVRTSRLSRSGECAAD